MDKDEKVIDITKLVVSLERHQNENRIYQKTLKCTAR